MEPHGHKHARTNRCNTWTRCTQGRKKSGGSFLTPVVEQTVYTQHVLTVYMCRNEDVSPLALSLLVAHAYASLNRMNLGKVCVCVCVQELQLGSWKASSALEYISGFVRVVCLALLPWGQTLQTGFRATTPVSISAVYDGTEQGRGRKTRGAEWRSKIVSDRTRKPHTGFAIYILFLPTLSFTFTLLSPHYIHHTVI